MMPSRLISALFLSACALTAQAQALLPPPAAVEPASAASDTTPGPTSASSPKFFHGASSFNLPDMGEPADLALSPQLEAQIGAEVVGEMYAAEYILEDPELTDYLSSVGWRLGAVGSEIPPAFEFFVVRDPRINAFALPSGDIAFNAGTIIAASNESELASVLAHEEAHVTQRHIARSINDTEVANIATLLAMVAAIVAGSVAGSPSAIVGALGIGQGINYNRSVTYTRGNEMEADRVGIRTAAAAGYDPYGMVSFFGRFEQQVRLYGNGLPEMLQNHPVNATRITEATERAAQYPKRHYVDSPGFLFSRARSRVLTSDQPKDAVEYFQGQLTTHSNITENTYGYALALSLSGRYAEALDAFKPVYSADPTQVNVGLLQASLLTALDRPQEASAVYRHVLDANSQSAAAVLEYADSLIQGGRPMEGRQLLLSHEQLTEGESVTRMGSDRLLAQAAAAVGYTAEAQYQTANYLYHRGAGREAVEQLDSALRLETLKPDDRARLLARRREIIATIPKNQLAGPG